ncbi:hypothetical protein ELQ57_22650 [Salmonella enterica subsp. enterica serovar Teko]|nr:hypothetical protein [Salmonella enterica]EAA7937187.1 hypothetical protein [Salmonella enterica subsp. enterica serovar Teko]EDV9142539.1 hypothetical protein [Salmonella enterica subsp. enterica serovar Gombe]EDV9731987.1 hypothetical protein [Salmonella enterica subsp. enterica]EAQ2080494.1 hypothetical protein [Salmonella enterica]
MSLRYSGKKLKMLALVVLIGISAWAMIIVFKIGLPCGLSFEKPYSEGSLPALLCPASSVSSSLR